MPPALNNFQPYLSFTIKLLIVLVSLFAFSRLVGPLPFKVINTGGNDIFTMSGEGRVTVKPDVAVINVGVDANAPTVKEAQEKINIVINGVTEAVKELGVEEKDIKTENYNVYPNYDFGKPIPLSAEEAIPSSKSEVASKLKDAVREISVSPGAPENSKITSYNANASLRIKVRNLDKVNEIIDTATETGANQIGGVSFEVDDRSKAENEARMKAVEDARKKAKDAAKAAGIRLGKVVNYYESSNAPPFYGYGGEARMDVVEDGSYDTSIEPGSLEVVINATLNYEVR
ncbi:SIMPL domain-containing protein [Candidatus Daviesbacteria bacterium]|nr:SIMPL domain-containing protein [Candidatus Daviesbacteria bacterium]